MLCLASFQQMNHSYLTTLFYVSIAFVPLLTSTLPPITLFYVTIEYVPLTASSLPSMFKYRKLLAELLERRSLSVSRDIFVVGLVVLILKGKLFGYRH